MDMCYDGALVMPRNYAVMDEEEMMYLEGGGTLRVIASKATVRTICRASVALVCGAIGTAFGTLAGGLLSAGLGTLIYDFIIDMCGVQYKAIDKSWTKNWLPTKTFNLNNYV